MKYKRFLNFFGEGAGEGTGEGTVQDAAGQETVVETPEDLDAKFEALIKGEYKEQYNKRFQKAMNGRHKEYKTMQETLNAVNPIMDLLKGKYGTQDVNALHQAILNDDSYYEQEALQRGMSVEQLKYVKQMEAENARYRQQEEQFRQQEASRRQAEIWQRQEQELRLKVPDLDVAAELQNPEFERLLMSGVGMETAYQVVHMDDIMSGSMNYAAQKAKEATVKNIQARGMRPNENGIAQSGGDPGKKSVSDMTTEEILALAEKAKREGYASL